MGQSEAIENDICLGCFAMGLNLGHNGYKVNLLDYSVILCQSMYVYLYLLLNYAWKM